MRFISSEIREVVDFGSGEATPVCFEGSNRGRPRELENIGPFDYANLSLTPAGRVSRVGARKTGQVRGPLVADGFYGE